MPINLDRFDTAPEPNAMVAVTIRGQEFKIRRERVEEYFEPDRRLNSLDDLKEIVLETLFEQNQDGKPSKAGQIEFDRWWEMVNTDTDTKARMTFAEIRAMVRVMTQAARGEIRDDGDVDPKDNA